MKRLSIFLAAVALAWPSHAPAQDDGDIVATVNGTVISRDDVARFIAGLSEEYRQAPVEELWEPVLERLINRSLVVSAARAEGLDGTDAYVREMRHIGRAHV